MAHLLFLYFINFHPSLSSPPLGANVRQNTSAPLTVPICASVCSDSFASAPTESEFWCGERVAEDEDGYSGRERSKEEEADLIRSNGIRTTIVWDSINSIQPFPLFGIFPFHFANPISNLDKFPTHKFDEFYCQNPF